MLEILTGKFRIFNFGVFMKRFPAYNSLCWMWPCPHSIILGIRYGLCVDSVYKIWVYLAELIAWRYCFMTRKLSTHQQSLNNVCGWHYCHNTGSKTFFDFPNTFSFNLYLYSNWFKKYIVLITGPLSIIN